jgi:endonuclease III related protein
MLDKDKLLELYTRLLESYGPQHWWPADTPFEVMVGAVLTQNTSWKNVEIAIRNLREAGSLDLPMITGLEVDDLAKLIRPSGYYNIKARRLKNLCAWLEEMGGMDKLSLLDTPDLRDSLLSVNGIGPETADDILLYALHRPVFVIDTYTRRLLEKLDLIAGDETYESLRSAFESALGADSVLFNEYHALIVRHAKQKCNGGKVGGDRYCKHCYVETGEGISQVLVKARQA